MPNLKIFFSDSFNPHLNLATEEWLFHSVDPSSQILFLWQNEETVVIGRNQNPWAECNLTRMKEDGVHLARRTTGGGAVFHDRGNTNFTFLSPKAGYRRENNIAVVLNAMKEFGVEGFASGRNDLLLQAKDGPRKFSGSAYREKLDRAFHHGTLLLHADLSRLSQYLTPNPKKLIAKGKESVRAQVTNLNEWAPGIEHEGVVEAMAKGFEVFYGAKAEKHYLSMASLNEIPELKAQFEQLSSFDWLYGRTLEFNQSMDAYLKLGFFDFHFRVENAVIAELQIFTDCLYPALVEEMHRALKGKAFTSVSLSKALEAIAAKEEFFSLAEGIREIATWLAQEAEA
ncbi:MAG: lipoate--protein ligase [Proteobacteria bacterium]|nr:MAG: lipoate--protein ligase [Pseudomonadota bacterium]